MTHAYAYLFRYDIPHTRSSYACLLRMPDTQTEDMQVMAEGAQQERTYYEFLEGCLRHRSEMVCGRMLTYAHVCTRMHTYADVC